MKNGDLLGPLTRRGGGRARLMATAVALTTGALGAGLLVSALPAYADVTTAYYTIGMPSAGVSTVVAAPSSVVAGASTNFEVSFTASAGLAGASDSFINLGPSTALASPPVNVTLVGGSCIQAGTAGAGGAGTDVTAGLSIELDSSCVISAGNTVQVYFTASAPSTTGSFYFTVTTSANATVATSNAITTGTSTATLAAALYGFGANTTYAISNMPVANLSVNPTTLVLTAIITGGTEALSFYPGVAGYSVSYTPSGGTATSDPVTAASVVANSVTLTLTSGLVNGDTLNITATGTNPVTNASAQSNAINVQPGNGTSQLTSSITFGNSVSATTVSASTPVAGASATYTVGFRATDAVSVGGAITLSESAGPTNFTAVSGIAVTDTTQGWHYVATGPLLASGVAIIPISDAVLAGDFLTVTLANVTNPPAITVSDFQVSTTSDALPASAPPYSIGTNASPGVTVSVNPATTSSLAAYTITNLRANAAMTGAISTITVQGPSGTVFPNSAAFYSVLDSTSPAGSGTARAVGGGGTNVAVVTVPNSINSGDVLALSIQDAINPSVASSTDSITLLGSVTALAAVAPTTVPPTTTTTVPKPVVSTLTTMLTVSDQAVKLGLTCSTVRCTGVVTLVDVRTELGHSNYDLAPGTTGSVAIALDAQAVQLLAGAKDHTITATETVTVTGGATVAKKITVANTTPVPTVTTHPAVSVSNNSVKLGLSCADAACTGTVTLVDIRTELGHSKYALAAGTTGYVTVGLFHQASVLLAGAKNHSIDVTETISVTGGKTVTKRITLVG